MDGIYREKKKETVTLYRIISGDFWRFTNTGCFVPQFPFQIRVVGVAEAVMRFSCPPWIWILKLWNYVNDPPRCQESQRIWPRRCEEGACLENMTRSFGVFNELVTRTCKYCVIAYLQGKSMRFFFFKYFYPGHAYCLR